MKLCILCAIEFHDEDPSPYFNSWDAEMRWIIKATACQQIAALAEKNYDVFVNLCDGCVGDDAAGIEVVYALEQHNLPFTGAASDFYDPSRDAMKRACKRAGVPTPGYVFVSDVSALERSVAHLNFPLIVKHPNGHSSVGLFKASRVENFTQLQTQVRRMISEYGGALIEEFVPGREFDVLVVENADDPTEPFTYLPAEFIFPPNESFKHYDLKWVNYDAMNCVPCNDSALTERLQAMSKKLFVALNGSGYARCDIRMDARGELFMLEINANCGIFYPPGQEGSADFILTQDAAGHRGFIERILRAGLARHQRRNQLYSNGARRKREPVFSGD